jgi:drug/metabolite transporter (DMT)-like permease
MSWAILSLSSALIWAIVNMIDKHNMSGRDIKPSVPLMVIGLMGALISIGIYFFKGFQPLSAVHLLMALGMGVLYWIMALCYFKAVQLEEISRVIPIYYTQPLFIAIFAAITLGEIFSPLEYLGILLLILGSIGISLKPPYGIKLGKAFWLVFFSAFLNGIQYTVTKYLLGFADYWTVFAWIRVGTFLAVIPLVLGHSGELKEIFKKDRKGFSLVSLSEFLNFIALFVFTVAFSMGPVTLVHALSTVQSFFVLAFSVIASLWFPSILKENVEKRTVALKLVAIAVMFIGAQLIS